MNRHHTVIYSIALAALVVGLALPASGKDESARIREIEEQRDAITASAQALVNSRPNIVLILADDMGIDSVQALNEKCGIPTPNLDTLLKQGIHFTDAHSGSALCSPTRYGVLTGRYSWRSRLTPPIVPPTSCQDLGTQKGDDLFGMRMEFECRTPTSNIFARPKRQTGL